MAEKLPLRVRSRHPPEEEIQLEELELRLRLLSPRLRREVILLRVQAGETRTRMEIQILRQVALTTKMRDMVCCLGYRQ